MIYLIIASFASSPTVLVDYLSETHLRPVWDPANGELTISVRAANYSSPNNTFLIARLGGGINSLVSGLGVVNAGRSGSCDNTPIGWLNSSAGSVTWNAEVSAMEADFAKNGWTWDGPTKTLSRVFSIGDIIACDGTNGGIFECSDVQHGLLCSSTLLLIDVYDGALEDNSGGLLSPWQYFLLEEFNWSIIFTRNASVTTSLLTFISDVDVMSAAISVGPSENSAVFEMCSVTLQNTTPPSTVPLAFPGNFTFAGVVFNPVATGPGLGGMTTIEGAPYDDILSYTCNDTFPATPPQWAQCWRYEASGITESQILDALTYGPSIVLEFFGIIDGGGFGLWSNSLIIQPPDITTGIVTNETESGARCFFDSGMTNYMPSGSGVFAGCKLYCVAYGADITQVTECTSDNYDQVTDTCAGGVDEAARWGGYSCPSHVSEGSSCVWIIPTSVGGLQFNCAPSAYVTFDVSTASSTHSQQVEITCPHDALLISTDTETIMCIVGVGSRMTKNVGALVVGTVVLLAVMLGFSVMLRALGATCVLF